MPLTAFPYYGGKTQYANRIADLMPPHHTYVEAFGGGGSVLLAKPESTVEVFNDIDEHLVNFFRVLRTHREALLEWLADAPYAKAEQQRWARQFYGDEDLPQDLGDVARAGRWFALRHMQFGAVTKGVSGFSRPGKRSEAGAYRANIQRLEAVRDRFAEVCLEADDYQNLIEFYDGPETLWYFDPPYVGNEHEYLGEIDHATLVETLAELEGNWLISYREFPDGLEDLATTIREFDGVDTAVDAKYVTDRVACSFDPQEKATHEGPAQRTLRGWSG